MVNRWWPLTISWLTVHNISNHHWRLDGQPKYDQLAVPHMPDANNNGKNVKHYLSCDNIIWTCCSLPFANTKMESLDIARVHRPPECDAQPRSTECRSFSVGRWIAPILTSLETLIALNCAVWQKITRVNPLKKNFTTKASSNWSFLLAGTSGGLWPPFVSPLWAIAAAQSPRLPHEGYSLENRTNKTKWKGTCSAGLLWKNACFGCWQIWVNMA